MRWKLFRRRLSISAPRVAIRSHMPWPLRWVVLAVAFGFSASLALWAFEFGKEIAGLERTSKEEVAQLRSELETLRAERERAQSIANTADSLLKTERVTQDRLSQQLRQSEAEVLALKADLGFFERLLPAAEDGRDLNPLLQDPGLVFHPPMLYMGYVGFAVAFAFAIAALLAGRLDAAWARWSRP